MNRYVKGIIAGVGAAAGTLEIAYPTWKWLPAVTYAAAAIAVVWFPNAPQKTQDNIPRPS